MRAGVRDWNEIKITIQKYIVQPDTKDTWHCRHLKYKRSLLNVVNFFFAWSYIVKESIEYNAKPKEHRENITKTIVFPINCESISANWKLHARKIFRNKEQKEDF